MKNKTVRLLTLLALALAATTLPVFAQSPTSDEKNLTLDGAKSVLAAAMTVAKNDDAKTGAIAVVDRSGNLILLERLDGTFPAASQVATGKARTAALFQKATRNFEESINKGRTALVAVEGMTPLKGGVPILIDGKIVGAVGVSGAASQDRDDEIAMAGAAAFASQAR
jgi:glc operon protein GlcG